MADSTSVTLPARPLERVTPAKEAARTAFSDRLTSAYHLDKRHADAIARMVVDPTAARHQVDQPVVKRFPGGEAKFIVADVYSAAVSASPINPRETERRIYPVAARTGEQVWPPLLVEPAVGGQPVLALTADSREHVTEVLEQSAQWLQNKNAELREAITLDGVLEPVTVILAEIRHRDGTDTAIVPISVDGSTRTTHCHELTGFDPVEVVYRWPQAPAREWRGKLHQIMAVQDVPSDEISEKQAVSHRALTYQARILVGIEPVRRGVPVDVVTANRAIVGGIHVGHPKEWSPGSQLDEIADAVLDQLVHDGKLEKLGRDYLAGLIKPDELEPNGFSVHQDMRAAHIAHEIFAERNAESVSASYRSLAGKQKLGRNDKPNIASELIMRAFRNGIPENQISAVRSALQRTINMSEWRGDVAWQVTGRSPDHLLDVALTELRSGHGFLGSSQLELGMLATYWLVSKRALRRDTRETAAQIDDTRSGASILRAMLQDERGLRQLHRTVIDGRAGRPIQTVNGKGEVQEKSAGGPSLVTDAWLRKTFGSGANDDGDDSTSGITQLSPEAELTRLFRDARDLGEKLADLVLRMGQIKEDGIPVAMSKGVPAVTANDIAEKLRKAANLFSLWGTAYQQKNAQLHIEDPDDVDLLEEAYA